MENYRKMYSTLFNAITDALAQIENQNYGDAKSTLIAAGAAILIYAYKRGGCRARRHAG